MCEKISFWRLFKDLFHFILNNYKNAFLHINKQCIGRQSIFDKYC